MTRRWQARVDGGSTGGGVFYGGVGGGALHPPIPCEGDGEDEERGMARSGRGRAWPAR
jgi:hypothetical protein